MARFKLECLENRRLLAAEFLFEIEDGLVVIAGTNDFDHSSESRNSVDDANNMICFCGRGNDHIQQEAKRIQTLPKTI